MKTGSMPAAEQADSYTTSGVISMIQGLHYKQVNGRDEPMLQNNKPNNKLNNKLDLKKRLFSMLLVLALLSGSVPGALPAAAVTTDGYVLRGFLPFLPTARIRQIKISFSYILAIRTCCFLQHVFYTVPKGIRYKNHVTY